MKTSIHLLLLAALLSPLQIASASNDAMAKAQYMIRQLNAEKNRVTSENQKLLAEKAELEKKFASLQKKYDKLSSNSRNNSKSMSTKIAGLSDELKTERDAHQETAKQLAAMTGEKDRVFHIAVDQTHAIDQCVSNNHKLYDINQALLGKYENKGIWSVISQDEPFTGLKQVEIENLVDDYQYRLDDLRVVEKKNETLSQSDM